MSVNNDDLGLLFHGSFHFDSDYNSNGDLFPLYDNDFNYIGGFNAFDTSSNLQPAHFPECPCNTSSPGTTIASHSIHFQDVPSPIQTSTLPYNNNLAFDWSLTPQDTAHILGDLDVAPASGISNNGQSVSYASISPSDWFETDEAQLSPMVSMQPTSIDESFELPLYSPPEQAMSSSVQPGLYDRWDGTKASPPSRVEVEQDSEETINCRSHICQWLRCRKGFSSSEQLHKHVKFHTQNLKSPANCQWAGCNKSRVLRCLLNKHLKTHTKPFQCSESDCNHPAANLRDLQRHLRTHGTKTGDRAFSCPYPRCEYSQNGDKEPFKRLDHAKRHIVRKHPNSLNHPIPIVI